MAGCPPYRSTAPPSHPRAGRGRGRHLPRAAPSPVSPAAHLPVWRHKLSWGEPSLLPSNPHQAARSRACDHPGVPGNPPQRTSQARCPRNPLCIRGPGRPLCSRKSHSEHRPPGRCLCLIPRLSRGARAVVHPAGRGYPVDNGEADGDAGQARRRQEGPRPRQETHCQGNRARGWFFSPRIGEWFLL